MLTDAASISQIVATGASVVIDATNINPNSVQQIVSAATRSGATVTIRTGGEVVKTLVQLGGVGRNHVVFDLT